MKLTKGKANPKMLNDILINKLNKKIRRKRITSICNNYKLR